MEKIYLLYLNDENTLIGKLFSNIDGTREVYSFEYDKNFINKYKDFYLGPDVFSYIGRQYSNEKLLFGFVSDLMPDRWGRALIERSERIKSKKVNGKMKSLHEIDYLVNTLDISRMGAIRIKEENGNEFLAANSQNIPPYISLRKLEQASLEYEDDFYNDKFIEILLAPGSSLGGTRPKANIYDAKGELYIAKFPSKKDEYDVGLFEKVVNDLARLCNINVPDSFLEEKKNKYGSIYLSKRFDRENKERIHYASLMTLIGASDDDKEKHSYLEIFDFINRLSKEPKKDKEELFRRIIFNILINNCDDHLRNHGFIYKNNSWSLAPAFDVNISIDKSIHTLKFVSDDTSDISNIYDVGKYLEYSSDYIDNQIRTISTIINNNFEKLARKYKAKKSEIKIMKKVINQFSESYNN